MAKATKSACLILVCIILCMCVVFVRNLFSQEKDNFKDVSFSSTTSSWKFFDHNSGNIYVYSSETGDFIKAWTIVELGKNLERLRLPNKEKSFFTVE
jgi:hypothetical protein